MLALGVASQTPAVARPTTWINFARRLANRGSRLHTAHRPWAQLSAGSLQGNSQAARKKFSPALWPAVHCRSSNNSVTGNSDIFLIIYSKPGCHLCDGLKLDVTPITLLLYYYSQHTIHYKPSDKEKVQAVLAKAMFQPSPLSHANLQVRNILDEPEWEAAYGMVIPVLTAIKSGEKEEIKIPRAPPRITADRLADHIAKSLKL